ncbi:MAG: alpha/beta hydrolase [bacterium]|nr:alpha/beta hydrolase [bacterium]
MRTGQVADHSSDSWAVPEPRETVDVQMDDGTVVTVRRHGNLDGRRLVLSHGNGLAIDLYYPFWSLLADDFDLMVHDLRNHGWNSVGDLRDHTVPTFARDHDSILAAIGDSFGEKPKAGVFHSVSALAALLSPAKGSGYSALVLFDPPLCQPGKGHSEFETAAKQTSALTRRRSPWFASSQTLIDVVQLMPAFRGAVPGIAELLATTTLREDPGGDGYELRCPREYEAQIIDYANVYAVSVDFGEIMCPVKVIGADPTIPYSYLPTLDLSDILSVDYDFLPDATHFLQLEQPTECVAMLREFLDSLPGA